MASAFQAEYHGCESRLVLQCEHSSVGRTSASQAECRGFEFRCSLQTLLRMHRVFLLTLGKFIHLAPLFNFKGILSSYYLVRGISRQETYTHRPSHFKRTRCSYFFGWSFLGTKSRGAIGFKSLIHLALFIFRGIGSSYQSRKSSSMVRAAPEMEKATGSNPVSLTNTSRPFFQFMRQMEFLSILCKEQVVGSNPTCGWLVLPW